MTNEVRQYIRLKRHEIIKRRWKKDVCREAGNKRAEIMAQRRAAKEAGI